MAYFTYMIPICQKAYKKMRKELQHTFSVLQLRSLAALERFSLAFSNASLSYSAFFNIKIYSITFQLATHSLFDCKQIMSYISKQFIQNLSMLSTDAFLCLKRPKLVLLDIRDLCLESFNPQRNYIKPEIQVDLVKSHSVTSLAHAPVSIISL